MTGTPQENVLQEEVRSVDEKTLEEKGRDEKTLRKKGRDEKTLGKKGRDEKALEEKGRDEKALEDKLRDNEEHPSSSRDKGDQKEALSAPTPPMKKWHPAVRDWNLCGLTMLILLFSLIMVLLTTRVLRNFMITGFFVIFILFLVIVIGNFLYTARKITDYLAALFPGLKNSKEFLERLEKELSEKIGEPDEMDSVTGNTFGLLAHVKTLKLETGEVIALNEVRVNSGFILGLYLLVNASTDSMVWGIIEGLVRK